jgi:hypothetical protein
MLPRPHWEGLETFYNKVYPIAQSKELIGTSLPLLFNQRALNLLELLFQPPHKGAALVGGAAERLGLPGVMLHSHGDPRLQGMHSGLSLSTRTVRREGHRVRETKALLKFGYRTKLLNERPQDLGVFMTLRELRNDSPALL